jgi:fumarate hydratase subunit beta
MELDKLISSTAGESVELTGSVLSLRDASAARLAGAIERGEPLPVSLAGRVMYAVSPSPAPPGRVIGSAGPTTTARMARFLPALFSAGVVAVIGKGELHGDDMAAFTRHGAIYLAAVGGMGALLARHITAASGVAYDDLGPEALYMFELERFPAVVIIDRGPQVSRGIAGKVASGALIAKPPAGGWVRLKAETTCPPRRRL